MFPLFRRLCLAAALSLPLAASAVAPAADHHQHLFSPAIIALLDPKPGPDALRELTAEELIGYLDGAGIRRATVLSVAYMFGSPSRQVEDDYAKVKAENDWTAAQAAKYPDRLRALCGFNPLKDYALRELERCAAHPVLRHGIKMHFGKSDVQLENPAHIARLQDVFRAATPGRMKPAAAWVALRALPLTPVEVERIARNVAPYLR